MQVNCRRTTDRLPSRRLHRLKFMLPFGLASALIATAPSLLPAQEAGTRDDQPAPPAGDAEPGPDKTYFQQGRFVYQKNCIVCHGRFGEGDGELVKDWEVLPRNFRKANFKYRSTPYGRLPTDEDLTRTVRRGIAGSAMPVFSHLQDAEVRAVIEYLKFFSPAWREPDKQPRALPLQPRPAWYADEKQRATQAALGHAIYRATCASCHGDQGAGDGPAAAALKDSEDRPIAPADLRQSLKSGPEIEDIYRTILTGITGTPMIGFHGALQDAEAWQVAVYVQTLRAAED